MSEQVEEQGRAQAPLLDLFATAVHRFGSAWADLVAASLVMLVLGTLPIALADASGASTAGTSPSRWSPTRPRSTCCWASSCCAACPRRPAVPGGWRPPARGLLTGLLAGVLAVVLFPFLGLIAMPLLLLAVPSVAAGDRGVLGAIPHGVALAVRNFSRVWGVWLLAIVFSLPVWISVALVTLSFSSGKTQTFITLAVAAPVIWPFCALFVRALYGDLTGRLVVAPQDRSR